MLVFGNARNVCLRVLQGQNPLGNELRKVVRTLMRVVRPSAIFFSLSATLMKDQ